MRAKFPLLLLLLWAPAGLAQSRDKAFTGARVWSGSGEPIADAVLLVRDGRVAALGPAARIPVPPGAERIDLSGRSVVPGLVNAHGHVGQTLGLRSGPEVRTAENVAAQLALYARYGVTTVASLGGDAGPGFAARAAQDSPGLARARLLVAGEVIAAETVAEARRRLEAVAAAGPDFVKIRVDDNLGAARKMPEPVFRAVIAAAHERGLKVAAHLYYLDDAKALLRAGADLLAHSVRDREVDEELIGLLREKDVCLCPTLMREVSTFVYESTPAFFSDPFFLRDSDPAVRTELARPERQRSVSEDRAARQYKAGLPLAQRNLKRLRDAGVRIAFGTDSGPPGRFQGYFEHEELRLMTEAGLSARQALEAATADAARCLGLSGRVGTLAAGAAADFLVLGGDPLQDVRQSRALEAVYVAGNRVPAR